MPHDVSHLKLQLLGFQEDTFIPSFHLCLLLQTLKSYLHLHLQVSCHFMCFV